MRWRVHEISPADATTLADDALEVRGCHCDPNNMGRLRFELRTNRLKAECSTAELATRAFAGEMKLSRTAPHNHAPITLAKTVHCCRCMGGSQRSGDR
jgi:hypothetical protein